MLIDDSYWLLEFLSGDFILVHQPSLKISRELKAYHSILLSKFKSLAQSEDFHNCAFDSLNQSLANYYNKIVSRLNPAFDLAELTKESRHQFFIAAEKRHGYWISGLEILMGLDYEDPDDTDKKPNKLSLTSGDLEIDIIAGLMLQENNSNVEWLAYSKSPQYLVKLLTQMNNCRRGQDAIEELQRERDLEIVKKKNMETALSKSGFNF